MVTVLCAGVEPEDFEEAATAGRFCRMASTLAARASAVALVVDLADAVVEEEEEGEAPRTAPRGRAVDDIFDSGAPARQCTY